MSKNMRYVGSQIMANFKQGITASQIEEMLKQYTFMKLFPDVTDDSDELSRTYVIYVTPGEELQIIEQIKEKHGTLIEYLEQAPGRKMID